MANPSQISSTVGHDFMQVLVNMQAGVQQSPPTSSPYYLGILDGPSVTDTFTSTQWGPPYYCTNSVTLAANQIICGFFTCG
jgi:hypothetical protein